MCVRRDFVPQHVSQLGLRKGDIVIQDEVGVDAVGPEWRHVRHTVETVRDGGPALLFCGADSLVHCVIHSSVCQGIF